MTLTCCYSPKCVEGKFYEVRQKGSNITHLHDASEPLLLSTFLLSATGIGRRGGHSMEQREVVLYARSRSLRCWRAKRLLSRGGRVQLSLPLKKEMGMRRIVVLLASMALAMLLACGVALALPSETPDQTPMVNGTVRAIEHVGTNIWFGGKFTQVKSRDGTVIANVSNLAVFDSETNQYKNLAPKLGGTDSEVWDMSIYGQNVLIAGKFSGPTSTQKNLLLVDGNTGDVIRWYNAPSLRSALAAPDVGRVYGGGVSLSAFELSGKKLWSRAQTTVDSSLYPNAPSPSYRDLELDGNTIWAACACDAVDGKAAKALVKLSTEGVHDTSWRAAADPPSWGMSVVEANGALYLGTGGSDFLAKYDTGPTATGSRSWVRDTSGSLCRWWR